MEIRVLVVDDSQEIVQFLSLMLNQFGIYNISTAGNGVIALDVLESSSEPFDLIFVDLHMPEMDGVEFIKKLASNKFAGAVVISSSLDNRLVQLVANITKQRNLHILGCINKPITEIKLSNILKKYELLFHEKLVTLSLMNKQQLVDCLDLHYLVPFFQPKINKSTGELHGFEMLARIVIPGDINTILPDAFIPVAEANELIGRLSFLLIDQAFHQFAAFSDSINSGCKLSINISPILLDDEETIRFLEGLIDKHNFTASQIIIEITEQNAITKIEQLESLSRLRIKGFGLSLDDYGAGFTNVQQLKNLPFTEIKIDRSLIYNISEDKVSQLIVNSILEVAKELKIEVIAEGVESYTDFQYLSQLDYEFVMQGYLISKPKSVDDVHEWYKSWVSSEKNTVKEMLVQN